VSKAKHWLASKKATVCHASWNVTSKLGVRENISSQIGRRWAGLCQSRLDYPKNRKRILRGMIINEKKRIEGRTSKDIGPLVLKWCFARTHGSALFNRVRRSLAVVTFFWGFRGWTADRFYPWWRDEIVMFIQFSPIQCGRSKRSAQSRQKRNRHGALARKALVPVLPSPETFPTQSDCSEILSSNVSSSMARFAEEPYPWWMPACRWRTLLPNCHGLLKEGDDVVILTDILGDETMPVIWISRFVAREKENYSHADGY